ncbi:MAG: hypothetical protein BVN35_14530 [Proteobacteria bacterium ST_bin11]|nr:MAG: hypothetical protein BVN35_14530 [Proteobacteria bacterium ST_bin11]
MALLLLFVTANQLHSAWEEERMWALPSSHDWQAHVQWAVNLSLELSEGDPEALAIVDAYRSLADCDPETEFSLGGEHHYSHPDAVSRVLKAHWQYDLLVYSLTLNCMIYVSLVFRWTLFWMPRKSFRLMIYTTNVNWVSAIAQFFSFAVWVYVAFFQNTWLSIFGCALVSTIMCLEFVSCVISTKLRNCVVYMRKRLAVGRKQSIARVLRENGATEDEIDEETKTFEGNPMKIFDIILDAIATFSENLEADQIQRSKGRSNVNLRNKKKIV